MPYKDPEHAKIKNREYNRKWYQNNKAKHTAQTTKNKRGYRAKWAEFKASLSCSKCGAKHPAIIDFHHVIKDGTKREVNRLAAEGRYTAAVEETKKCVPLCANCHRIFHYEEHLEKKAARKLKIQNKKYGMEPKK